MTGPRDDEPGPGVDLVKRPDTLPERAIFDGELVDDTDQSNSSPTSRRPVVRETVHLITTLGRSGPAAATGRAGRQGVRAVWVTGQGGASLIRRAAAGATHGVLREQVRLARLAGDRAAVAEAAQQLRDAKTARLNRLVTLPKAVFGLAVAAGAVLAAALLVVVAVGMAMELTPGGETWASWWALLAAVLDVSGTVLQRLLVLAVWASGPVLVWSLWREGKRAADPPMWLRTSADGDDIEIDETTIAKALDALRIPQISTYLKAGTPLQFLTPARVDGRGTHAVIRLPMGVPAEKISKRRADLATGLHRLATEVWPTTGGEAGILDLWIADKGALAEGAGPYPLLTEGVVDVFKGVPFGRNLRGVPMIAPLMERNTICGGMPGQGKSSAARVIMVGAALDVTAELRIWVPDANFDFECFRPRCSRYVMGAEHADIEQILEDLRELHAEVQRRGQLLVRYEIPAVTREFASRDVGLHPLFCLLEEAHVAFQHPVYGGEIAKLFVDIVRLGRKRGIHMLPSTQAPTKDSMPRDVTRNCSNGIAFAVGDHVANDGLLGQGAYKAGHRATELIPGVDRGTAVVKGFSGQRSDIVQVYFLDVEKGNDQVTPIIERSLAAIARRGRGVPGTGVSSATLMLERDLLEDLDAVLGVEPLPIADVPPLLAAHAPDWQPYRSLTGKALRERLAEQYAVKVPSTRNRWPLDPEVVRSALAERDRSEREVGEDT